MVEIEIDEIGLPRDILKELNELRHSSNTQAVDRSLSDGVVRTENGEEIPIHRFLLYLASSFFAADFEEGKHVVHLRNTEADTARLVLDFIYTQKCHLTEATIDAVFRCACLHQIHLLGEACLQFYKASFRTHRCFYHRRLGIQLNCPELFEAATLFACQNFTEIYQKSTEFLELSVEEVRDYLSDDRLNARSEESVFAAIIRWIQADQRFRRDDLPTLLPTVRFGLISLPYFAYVVQRHELIEGNTSCSQVILEARAHLHNLDSRRTNGLMMVDFSHPMSRPRWAHELLFTFGGWSGGAPSSLIEVYDPRSNSWTQGDIVDATPRAYHGLQHVDNVLYVIGGFDGTEHFNSVRCFNPATKTWGNRSCMYHTRCYVATCVLDGLIYALGGFDGRSRMTSVERYDPKKNQWELLPPMRRQRSDGAAAALNGKVYVAGGFNGVEVMSSVECFDPASREWTYARAMSQQRSGVSLVAYRGCLYALGGFNGHHRLSCVEKFDPKTSEWSPVPSMNTPRSNFAAVVLDDLIFVVGGFNGSTTINHVECYDADTDSWHDVGQLNSSRSAMAACVVKGGAGSHPFSNFWSSKSEPTGPTSPFLPNPAIVASAFMAMEVGNAQV